MQEEKVMQERDEESRLATCRVHPGLLNGLRSCLLTYFTPSTRARTSCAIAHKYNTMFRCTCLLLHSPIVSRFTSGLSLLVALAPGRPGAAVFRVAPQLPGAAVLQGARWQSRCGSWAARPPCRPLR